ncbi:MAG: leucine-rich repeat domain-containing protein [Lachnospiraceae bacterium]|nr:leucine-rich repeat domain-containing protein [Lachnospiraceae bacterium]
MYDINADAIGWILSDSEVNDVVVTLIKEKFIDFLSNDKDFRSSFGNILIGGDYSDSDSDSDSNDTILGKWSDKFIDIDGKIQLMDDAIYVMSDSLYNEDYYPLVISNTPKKNQIYYRTSNRNAIALDEKVYNIKTNHYSKGIFNYGIITFKEDITEIPASLFKNLDEDDEISDKCKNLIEIKCNSAITSIGESAFEGCINLAKIEDISNVTKFGKNCFNKTQIKTVRVVNLDKGKYEFDDSGLEMITTITDKVVFDNEGNIASPLKDFINSFPNTSVQLKLFVPDVYFDKIKDKGVTCEVSPISEATIDDIGGTTGIWNLTNKSIRTVDDDLKSFKYETDVTIQGLQTTVDDQFVGLQARLDKFDGYQQVTSARLDGVIAELDNVKQDTFNQIDSVVTKFDGYQQDIDKKLKLEQEKIESLQTNWKGVQGVYEMVHIHEGKLEKINEQVNDRLNGFQSALWDNTESKFVSKDALNNGIQAIKAEMVDTYATKAHVTDLVTATNIYAESVRANADDAISYISKNIDGIQSEYYKWQNTAATTYVTKDEFEGVQTKIVGIQAQLKNDLNIYNSLGDELNDIKDAIFDIDDNDLSDDSKLVRKYLYAHINNCTLQSFDIVKSNFAQLSAEISGIQRNVDGHVKTDTLNNYALKTDLNSYYTKGDLNSKLGELVKVTEFENTLSDYVLKDNLQTTFSDYVTKVDLSNELTKVADFNGQLSNYVLKENLQTTLSNYATKDTLGDYVKTTTLDNYPTKDKLSLTLSDYAKTTTLSNYAKKTDLDNYVKNSSLSSYVTSDLLGLTLSGYIKSIDLTSYAKTSDVDTKLQSYYTIREINETLGGYITTSALTTRLDGYVTTTGLNSTLNGFVQTSVLPDYIKFIDINKTLEESYTTRDMVIEILDLVDDELSKISTQISGYTFSKINGLKYQWNETYKYNVKGNAWYRPVKPVVYDKP